MKLLKTHSMSTLIKKNRSKSLSHHMSTISTYGIELSSIIVIELSLLSGILMILRIIIRYCVVQYLVHGCFMITTC